MKRRILSLEGQPRRPVVRSGFRRGRLGKKRNAECISDCMKFATDEGDARGRPSARIWTRRPRDFMNSSGSWRFQNLAEQSHTCCVPARFRRLVASQRRLTDNQAMIFVLSIIAAAFYSVSSASLSRALKLRRMPELASAASDAPELDTTSPEGMDPAQRRKLTLVCATVAVVIHGWLIINQTGLPHNLSLPLATSISATTLTIVLIHIVLCLRQPADYLGLAVYPLAAISLLVSQASGVGTPINSHSIQIHVLLSLVSYSVLALAAAQAVLVSVQRHYLSIHKPSGIVRSLPPLDTTEQLLFTLLTVGFILLSLALGSGFIYLEDMFGQRLVHKTVLSCIGWAIFGILLFGRWRYGWRGKKAVHWTLGGYAMLILAFFGTKAIIEVILG